MTSRARMMKKLAADRRAHFLRIRSYPDHAAELIEFYRSRAPKSEMSITIEGARIDEFTAMERLAERARSMANAADRSGKFEGTEFLALVDAAQDYLARSDREV